MPVTPSFIITATKMNITILKLTAMFFTVILTMATAEGAAMTLPSAPTIAVRDTIVNKTARDTTAQLKDTIAISEVNVTARLSEHKGNTDTYQVTAKMLEDTRSAAQLLGKLPGMYYNDVSKVLKYMGSENIMLLVDGMERDASYILNMNPKRFIKITVENQPVGQYQDYNAVITFITRPHYEGYDGTLLAEGNFITGARNRRGHSLMKQNDQFQFTYTRNQWNVAMNAQYMYLDESNRIGYDRRYPMNDYFQRVDVPSKTHPNRVVRQDMGHASLWVDRMIGQAHRISLGFTVSPSKTDITEELDMISGSSGEQRRETTVDKTGQPSYIDFKTALQYNGRVRAWLLTAKAGFSRIWNRSDHTVSRPGYELEDFRRARSNYGWGGATLGRYFLGNKLYAGIYENILGLDYKDFRRSTGALLSKSTSLRNWGGATLSYFPMQSLTVGGSVGYEITRNGFGGFSDTSVNPRITANVSWSTKNLFLRFNYSFGGSDAPLRQIQDYGYFTDSLKYQRGNPLLKPTLKQSFKLFANIFRDLTVSAEYYRWGRSVFNIAGVGYGDDAVPFVHYMYQNGLSQGWKGNITYSKSVKAWNFAVTASVEGSKARYKGYSATKTLPGYNWHVMYNWRRQALQVYLSSSMRNDLYVEPQGLSYGYSDGYALSVVKFFFNQKLQIMAMWHLPLHFTNRPSKGVFESPAYVERTVFDSGRRDDNGIIVTAVWRFNGGQKTRSFNHSTESVVL